MFRKLQAVVEIGIARQSFTRSGRVRNPLLGKHRALHVGTPCLSSACTNKQCLCAAAKEWTPSCSSRRLKATSSQTVTTATDQFREAFDGKSLLYPEYNTDPSLVMLGVEHDPTSNMVIVHWNDDHSQKFPVVWLRDNCHCSICYDVDTHTRLKYMQDLDINIKVQDIQLSQDGRWLDIKWSDDHVSSLLGDWLLGNRFDQASVDPVKDIGIDYWGADVLSSGRLREYEFDDIINTDEALHDWLFELKELGISLIKNAPLESHQIHRVGDRVGYILPTSFGQYNDVVTVPDSDNIAYKSGYLQPHTDYSFCQSTPAFGIFHCIRQTESEGGMNMLIDGFKAAEELRVSDPEAFRLLTTYEVEYFAVAENKAITPKGYYHLARQPFISVNEHGKVTQVVTGEYHQLKNYRIPVDEVPGFYRAMKAFNQILLRNDNVFNYKLQPGDMLSFNNLRMLHGRSEYGMSGKAQGVDRHLQTCYFDIDCVESRIRIIENRLRQLKK